MISASIMLKSSTAQKAMIRKSPSINKVRVQEKVKLKQMRFTHLIIVTLSTNFKISAL